MDGYSQWSPFTLHWGGFSFLSANDINIKELPLFYWSEIKDIQDNTKPFTKKMIIWNNKDIKTAGDDDQPNIGVREIFCQGGR